MLPIVLIFFRMIDEIINGSNEEFSEMDPFELIGKIETGEIALLDFAKFISVVGDEPWKAYIS